MSTEILRNYLNQYNKLSQEEWEYLLSLSKDIILKKEEIIVRKNEHFDKEVFLLEGVVRGFLIDEKGNDKTVSFFANGNFMSIATLRNIAGRSIHNYQALCKTKLLIFDSQSLRDFFSGNELLNEIGKQIKQNEIERINARDKCLLQVNSSDKYSEFLRYYPTLEQFISQKHIASYLGITPVSLSRTKSKLITFDN
jgi:CRP-like cAMP-binding protein